MSLNQFTQEQLQEMSMLEMAYEILNSKKQAASFKEILDEITEVMGLTEEEVRARIAQFYTDLNIDGRFLALGENRWGLRVWYPVDQSEEETVTQVRTKAKKKKAKKVLDDEDLDIEEYDEIDEEDLDYDELDDFDDDDSSDDLDDDLDIDDLDDDDDDEDDDEDLLEDDDDEEFDDLDEEEFDEEDEDL